MSSLPIYEIIPELKATLATQNTVILQAPPGAGKTTVVPLELLDESWMAGQTILMLEPRRLATVASARRMSSTLKESLGNTVGYRVRLDSNVSANTRIEVVTEGILTRRIQKDPELTGVGCVIFDEFHERSLQADIGLALTRDLQGALREDLRILIMSATLNEEKLSAALDDATVLSSEGRSFPVETIYLPTEKAMRIEDATSRAVHLALRDNAGSILVFLPGEGEIRRVAEKLNEQVSDPSVSIQPLFGNLNRSEQDRAIKPTDKGERKIVLATPIAETSLTIEGVTVVIDSGLVRQPSYDPNSGLTRLVTVTISQDSASQRRGRAGRTAPGVCYRLWSKQAELGMKKHRNPEILTAELSSLVLELALWGVTDPSTFFAVDPPPQSAVSQAQTLLQSLDALTKSNHITAHGQKMAVLGVHPRLAAMIIEGVELGQVELACDLAALLSERDCLRFDRNLPQSDIELRLDAIRQSKQKRSPRIAGARVDHGALKRIIELSRSWHRKTKAQGTYDSSLAGVLLAHAYRDRLAMQRDNAPHRYRLNNGRGASLAPNDPLAKCPCIVVADLMGREREAQVFLAVEITRAEIDEYFSNHITSGSFVIWDSQKQCVAAREQVRLDSLILSDKPQQQIDSTKTSQAVIEGIKELGMAALPWTKELRNFQAREALVRKQYDSTWPDISDESLLATLATWLAPFLDGITRREHFAKIDLKSALLTHLDWNKQQALERLAPERLKVPEGSKIQLDYVSGDIPVLAVKLQMLFGATETPAVLNGELPVLIHLLSPAGRPVQITQDLISFWDSSYAEVKKEMKGRYPRHPWPDNPREAVATRFTKKRSAAKS